MKETQTIVLLLLIHNVDSTIGLEQFYKQIKITINIRHISISVP